MDELKTLIKKLLNQVPNRIEPIFDDVDSIIYEYNGKEYTISLFRDFDGPNSYRIALYTDVISTYRQLKTFYIDISEKEYMEIKWKIEEWNDYLTNQQMDQFKEFVESFSNNSMDELLND